MVREWPEPVLLAICIAKACILELLVAKWHIHGSHIWSPMTAKFAVYGPRGPVVTGDYLQLDRTLNIFAGIEI